MQRSKWIERKFTFDFPEGWMPNILERLRGTSIRIHEMISALPNELSSQNVNGKWSIKEHVGHLIDLEDLHEGRLDDFKERKPILRAADMANVKTNEAQHNKKSLQALLENFKARRSQFIHRLEQLDDDTQYVKSLHPRLQVMMRPIDVAYFTAEHDDHHLASMREIIKLSSK